MIQECLTTTCKTGRLSEVPSSSRLRVSYTIASTITESTVDFLDLTSGMVSADGRTNCIVLWPVWPPRTITCNSNVTLA